MTEPRKKNLGELDRQIADCKNELNINQSYILSQLAKYKTPEKTDPMVRTQTEPWLARSQNNPSSYNPGNVEGSRSPEKRGLNTAETLETQDIMTYIASIKKLQGTLQEKSYVMEVDYEKQRLNYESTIQRLTKEIDLLSYDLEKRNAEVNEKDSTINILRKQVTQLQAESEKLSEQLKDYKKENVELKLDNKKYKADNKVIMNHIDRLTRDTKTHDEKQKMMDDREMRVMKSLYQDTLPKLEMREMQKRTEAMNNLSNKIMLDDATDRNGQLKSLIRRLNEEIEILKTEKALLIEQNKEKTLNLESQKKVVELSEESNRKLQDVISKMGQKVMSLEQANQRLRESLRKGAEGQDGFDDYYSVARPKAGQFYYKK